MGDPAPLARCVVRHIWDAGFSSTRGRYVLGKPQRRTTKMLERLKHLLYGKRLRDSTAQPAEDRAQRDLINA